MIAGRDFIILFIFLAPRDLVQGFGTGKRGKGMGF